MATSPRDVKLNLSVETTGEESIKDLQTSLAALAKEGSEAAPEFQALADEIARLGAQQQAITSFRELSTELDRLSQRQVEAAAATEKQSAKLDEAARAADRARVAQAAAADAQEAARLRYRETADALTLLRNTYDENGQRASDYKAQVQALTAAKIAEKRALDESNAALTEAKQATTAAAKEQSALEKAYTRSNAAAEKAAAAARDQAEVVAAAAASAQALGVSTTNLAASQAQLSARFAEVDAEARALQGQLEVMAQAERETAAATEAAARAAEEQAAALKAVDAARVAQEAKALADTERLLAAEFQFAAESARRLVAAQDEAAASAARLKQAQSDDFTRKLALAQGLLTTELELAAAATEHAAREQQRLDAAQEQSAESARQAAAAAAAAGQKIQDAFGTVGVRSAEELQAEIVQVRTAMETLRARSQETGAALSGAFTAGEARINSLQRELRELNGQLTTGDRLAKLFSNSLGQIAAGNLIADAVGAMVEKIKELGRSFVTVITQTESMRRGLTAIYGSAQTATQQIEFLRSTSIAAGVSMGGIADSFVRFSAATQQSNIPLQVTNDLFASVTRAGATLGLSSERVTLALDALGQMASKGVVSMEELRQQLGDSLPGALSIAARGLGLTEQQLIKLVESGQLAARDLFPGLIEGLKSLQGESDTIQGSWGRLVTAFRTAAEVGGDAGWTQVLRGALEALRITASAVVLPLSGLVEVIFGLAKASAVLAGAIATGTNPMEALGQIAEDASVRQRKLTDAFYGTSEASTATSAALQQQAASANSSTSSTVALALAQQQAAVAGGALAGSALGVAQANVQMLASSGEATKAIEANIVASEKLLKAKQLEGAATLEAAQISGNAATIMSAQTQAATDNATAAQVVVAARQAEVAATQGLIDRITSLAAANGGLREDQQKLVESLQQKLAVQTASAEKSEQEARGLQATADAARVAAAVYADNSASLEAYNLQLQSATDALPVFRAQLEVANAELARQRELLAAGKATQEDVNSAQTAATMARDALTAATRRAGEAERLYNDALQDTAANLDLKARAESAAIQLTLAQVGASQQHAEVMARLAVARGDENMALYYTIQAKQREIETIRLTAQMKELEAKASIAQLEIQKQEIALNDPLREQKLAELNIRIQLEKVKLAEAGASQDVIRGIEAEISAMRDGNNVRTSSTRSIDQNTASRLRNADAIKAQTAAEQQGLTSDGFKKNADGAASGSFGNTIPVDKAFDVMQRYQKRTLTAADLALAEEAAKQALNQKEFLDAVNPAFVSQRASAEASGLVASTGNALNYVRELVQAEEKKKATPAGGVPTGASTTHKVQISFGGRAQTVGVATEADAKALTGILRQLENASGTAA